MTERLKWLEDALQGLAFWIGHRYSRFYNYPLPEAALVAEACSLIQARLPSPDLILLPECMYKNLVPQGASNSKLFGQSRVDLVICDKSAKPIRRHGGNISSDVNFVFEVKRGSAPKNEIDDDLSRLHKYLKASKSNTRAFLLLISERKAPCRFVNKNGNSINGSKRISDTDGYFRVRRTLKAATSFKGINSAHYACLIEVLQHK